MSANGLPVLGTMVDFGYEVRELSAIEEADDPETVILVWTVHRWMSKGTMRQRVDRESGVVLETLPEC